MKIAYLVNQYPQASHSFIRREILALEKAGHLVDRFTLRRSDAALPDPLDNAERDRTRAVLSAGAVGMIVATLAVAAGSPGRFFAALALAFREGRASDRGLFRHLVCLGQACVLARWLKAADVKHLHSHFGTNSTAVAMLAHVLSGVAYSFTVHGPEEFDRATGLGLLEKTRHAKFAVTISSFGRGQLMRWSRPDDWTKIRVVRCGLDDLFLASPPVATPANPRVVCVGRLVEQKAQLVLVEAAAILKQRGVPIEIRLVGDGPMRSLIEEAIVRNQLHDQVKILGWKSAAEVRGEMIAARLVAQPSLAEGLPVAIMESLALGRAVVTTQIAGIPELIDASCGWIVPPGDSDRLADALEQALAIPVATLDEMGDTGRRRVLQRHSADAEAGRLAGYIQDVSRELNN